MDSCLLLRQFISLLPPDSVIFIGAGSPCQDLTSIGRGKGSLGLTGDRSVHIHCVWAVLYFLSQTKFWNRTVILIENAGSMLPHMKKYIHVFLASLPHAAMILTAPAGAQSQELAIFSRLLIFPCFLTALPPLLLPAGPLLSRSPRTIPMNLFQYLFHLGSGQETTLPKETSFNFLLHITPRTCFMTSLILALGNPSVQLAIPIVLTFILTFPLSNSFLSSCGKNGMLS